MLDISSYTSSQMYPITCGGNKRGDIISKWAPCTASKMHYRVFLLLLGVTREHLDLKWWLRLKKWYGTQTSTIKANMWVNVNRFMESDQ